ncbi:MAG: AAA family ATPase, partial [Clostridium sp.]|nr:AAA family ATPase [Clostridium sp.]
MDFNKEIDFIREITEGNLSYDSQIAILFEILENILDKGAIRARTVKYKLSRYMKSTSALEKAYALVRIASDGKGTDVLPKDPNKVEDLIKESVDWIADEIARRYIRSNIEAQVEKSIVEKQEKYVDEVRLSILKKQKGSENKKTRKKYKDLLDLDTRVTSKNIMALLRPQNFDEVVGQERAVKSLISKLSSPYPQHIILYGPPGVGKTTAARIALEKVKELSYTPFDDKSKFVEVDGTTLRWDPREITNPLLGSVHDPIYQGS